MNKYLPFFFVAAGIGFIGVVFAFLLDANKKLTVDAHGVDETHSIAEAFGLDVGTFIGAVYLLSTAVAVFFLTAYPLLEKRRHVKPARA